MKFLLPLGSVVRLKDGSKSLIIVGRYQEDNDGNKYDYAGFLFPEGYVNSEMFFMFNQDDIEKVEFVGFVNSEAQVLDKKLHETNYEGESE